MKNNFRSLLGVAALAAGTLLAACANAATVTYDFSGTFSSRYNNSDVSSSLWLPGYLQAGLAFNGSIDFDVGGIADVNPDPTIGGYLGVIKEFSFTIAGSNWSMLSGAGTSESVTDNRPYDNISLIAIDAYSNFSVPPESARFLAGLFSSNASNAGILNSDAAISDFSIFPSNLWRFQLLVISPPPGAVATVYSAINGSLATLTYRPSEVPLPAAAWLFGSGVLGLLGISRRRRLVA